MALSISLHNVISCVMFSSDMGWESALLLSDEEEPQNSTGFTKTMSPHEGGGSEQVFIDQVDRMIKEEVVTGVKPGHPFERKENSYPYYQC